MYSNARTILRAKNSTQLITRNQLRATSSAHDRLRTASDAHPNARSQWEVFKRAHPNSRWHGVDLINDLLRKRTSSPNGWKQLATALKGHSIPRELIGNSERWRYINKPQRKTKAVTPLRPTSHTKTGLAWEFY